MLKTRNFITLSLFFFVLLSFSQKQANIWYFGNKAGLDFNNGPPIILTNGQLNTSEGCASISDAGGSLLFYTDGLTVWNRQHLVMANGTGLLGNPSTAQGAVIVQIPGNSNTYAIFTLDQLGGANGLRFSVVDLNLAAGMGSVTTKNTLLFTPSCEKLAATRHCNGVDCWVLSHDDNSNNFRAFLVNSAGVNTVAVVSAIGAIQNFPGCLKISPNGRKGGLTGYNFGSNTAWFELFDFDNSTGMVSNNFTVSTIGDPYGCEFSPDGTKFYGTTWVVSNKLLQWNLCAGGNNAIINSADTIAVGPSPSRGSMQLATDGKIYVARFQQQSLGVINSPNSPGNLCNYVDVGQSVSPKLSMIGLPNFISTFAKQKPGPFQFNGSQTVDCSSVSFSASIIPPGNATCSASSPSYSSMYWNFGDPASGSQNTSTLANPQHTFSAAGTYTIKQVFNFNCGADTVTRVISINGPAPSVSTTASYTICSGNKVLLSANGAHTYSWSNGASGPTTIVSPGVSTIFTVLGTNTISGCTELRTITVSVSGCLDVTDPGGLNGALVFPNPATQELYITGAEEGILLLFDETGNLAAKFYCPAGTSTLKLNEFKSGMYFFRLLCPNNKSSGKIIISN